MSKLKLLVFGKARCGKTPIVRAISKIRYCRFEDEIRLFENVLATKNPQETMDLLCRTVYRNKCNIIADRTGCGPHMKPYDIEAMNKARIVDKFIFVSRSPYDTMFDEHRVWKARYKNADNKIWEKQVKPNQYRRWEKSAQYWLQIKDGLPHLWIKFEDLADKQKRKSIASNIAKFLSLSKKRIYSNLEASFDISSSKIGISSSFWPRCNLNNIDKDESTIRAMGYKIK